MNHHLWAWSDVKTTWEQLKKLLFFSAWFVFLQSKWIITARISRTHSRQSLGADIATQKKAVSPYQHFPGGNGLTRISYGGDPSGSGATFPG